VDRSGVRRAMAWTSGGIAAGLVLCLIPSLMLPGFYARALTPWLNWPRPSLTKIEVPTGDRTVAQGERLHIEAVLRGFRIPNVPEDELKSRAEACGADGYISKDWGLCGSFADEKRFVQHSSSSGSNLPLRPGCALTPF